MSSRAYGAAFRHSGQVVLTLGCMPRVHQVLFLIPHTHLLGTLCHHTSLHKFRIIKRRRRRRHLIHDRVPLRTPLTLLPHRKAAEVAVGRPAKRQKHRRRSSHSHSLVVLGGISFYLTVQLSR